MLPAHRAVNQRLKRDRLPSALLLAKAGDKILEWWRAAYLSPTDLLLPMQFGNEARASLPGLRADAAAAGNPEQVFDAVGLQRVRLRQDQQMPEWTP